MSCKICGRGNCTESFHSLEEQQNNENAHEKAIDYFKQSILRQINCLKDQAPDGDKYLVDLSEVISIIENT